jgi:hypothetical protein
MNLHFQTHRFRELISLQLQIHRAPSSSTNGLIPIGRIKMKHHQRGISFLSACYSSLLGYGGFLPGGPSVRPHDDVITTAQRPRHQRLHCGGGSQQSLTRPRRLMTSMSISKDWT